MIAWRILRRCFAVGFSLGILGAAVCRGADINLSAEKTDISVVSGDVFVLKIDVKGSADVALKVYDGSGKVVRVLAGKHLRDARVEIPWNIKDDQKHPVKPGVYTVRLESGWSLALDKGFGQQGILAGPPFVSPRDLAVDRSGNLFVLDGGAAILYKYRPDGSPANDIAGKNKIAASSVPSWGSVAVGPDGRIYLSLTHTTDHQIAVYDGKTGERVLSLAGFFADDEKDAWKGGIGYPSLVRLNGDNRLYVTAPGYEMLACYDPRQPGKTGAQWVAGRTPETREGWCCPGDAGATDGRNVLYLGSAAYTERNALIKLLDQGGKNLPEKVSSETEYIDAASGQTEPMRDIYGVACAGAGDVYVVLRSLAKVVRFVDSGNLLESVASVGRKGKDAAKLEFMVPAAIAASPDGRSLYIAEDGEKISDQDSAPGLARVTKYAIIYSVRKELSLTVKP